MTPTSRDSMRPLMKHEDGKLADFEPEKESERGKNAALFKDFIYRRSFHVRGKMRLYYDDP